MTYKDLNIDGTGKTVHDLAVQRAKLAKRVNQQLRRLEQSKSLVSGEAYRAGAYDEATEYLRETGRKRFSESVNYFKEKDKETGETAYNLYALKKEILELDRLTNMKTFTITGNREIERERINTFVEEHGLSRETASDDSFYEYLNSSSYDYILKSQLSSETLVNIFDTYRDANRTGEEIQAAIDEAVKQHEEANAKSKKPLSMSVSDLVDSLNSTLDTDINTLDVLPAGGSKVESGTVKKA